MRNIEQLQPGQYYLIYNNGNNKDNLFIDAINYPYFLYLWHKYIDPIANLYCYVLTDYQFQFLIRVKDENAIQPLMKTSGRNAEIRLFLSQCFSNFFNAYAKAVNKFYSRTGSLFQERYCRRMITGEEELRAQVCYIHVYPETIDKSTYFETYAFSSYSELMQSDETRLDRQTVMKWFGNVETYVLMHQWCKELSKSLMGFREGVVRELLTQK
jgi:hypothetical protein